MNISRYQQQGFVGVDVCLMTSLHEYGLIWKEYKRNLKKRGVEKGEILAICSSVPVSQPLHEHDIDYGYFKKSDLLDYDWIDWKLVAGHIGTSVEDLKGQDTGNLLYSLIGFYGVENFF